ncbi:MAG: hypothetical protein EB127_17290 [Alphaproteobacteria bacterium]|nr:hypothetical protein [Alphaproteobacteria bacterium]
MSITIRLLDSPAQIEKNINIAIAEHINGIITREQNRILNRIKALIPSWIESQPEIVSLRSSSPLSLVGQFGISGDSNAIVSSIIGAIVDATSIKFIKYSANLRGGLELQFQPATFGNLLGLSAGHTVFQGGDLHWLDWLLLRGDNIIITNYQYNPATGLGRSGLGNMIGGGAFRVPPEFAGTKDDNFITRAFLNPEVETQLSDVLSRVFV